MSTPQTWHYGLVAEWWAEFNHDGPEIDYFRRYTVPKPETSSGPETKSQNGSKS